MSGPQGPRSPAKAALMVGALGVVFGDIGTSPIYTIQTVFNPEDPHPVTASTDSVFGIISLIFWSVTLIVTIKYVLLVLRADNNGEGGIFALITLIRGRERARRQEGQVHLGGARHLRCLAVLRRQHDHPGHLGTVRGRGPQGGRARSGASGRPDHRGDHHDPVRRAATGHGPDRPVVRTGHGAVVPGDRLLRSVRASPSIRPSSRPCRPTYALGFLTGHFSTAFFALAAVVLAITGAEALYADLGHFGRSPITRAWLFLVFPACILSYLGQGALVLEDPNAFSSPFFLLVPGLGPATDGRCWPRLRPSSRRSR